MEAKRLLFITLTLTFIFSSCVRTTVEPEGPSLTSLYSPVELEAPFSSNIKTLDYSDAAKDTVFFMAEFNRVTDWKLVFDNSNGVKYELEGKSKSLSLENNFWIGEAFNFPGYLEGDQVEVQLMIPSQEKTLGEIILINVDLKSTGKDRAFNNEYNVPRNEDQFYAWQDNDYSTSSKEFIPSILSNGDVIYIKGVPKPIVDGDFVNGCNVKEINSTNLNDYSRDEIYINFMVYGFAKGNTLLVPSILLEDNNEKTADYNSKRRESVSWSGWKMVSFQYSEFTQLETETRGYSGSLNPELLEEVKLKIFTSSVPNDAAEVECAVRSISISVGKPMTF